MKTKTKKLPVKKKSAKKTSRKFRKSAKNVSAKEANSVPRPPIPGERIYWNEDTELAIDRYNKTDDLEERERIFKTHLAYPLDKMAENVINRFKFPYINQTYDDLKRQVISHLMCNLHKFSIERGHKAFSYFSVIAKNYLILHNQTAWKETKRSVSLNDPMADDVIVPIEEMTELEIESTETKEEMREFMQLFIQYWERNVYRHFKKKRDLDIVNAILELFRHADGIENFNKKALYLLIREQTDAKTSYITKVISKMKSIVAQQMIEFNEHGTIASEESEFFEY